jgi:hypothetical protein
MLDRHTAAWAEPASAGMDERQADSTRVVILFIGVSWKGTATRKDV